MYVARDYRRCGVGKAVLAAFINASAAAGFHKVVSRVFCENLASRTLRRRLGFEEIGVHRRPGRLDDIWRNCVIVERLLDRGAASFICQARRLPCARR